MLALFLGLFLSTFSMLFLHFLKAFPVNKHFSCQASGSGWGLLRCFLGLQRPSAALTHTLLRHLPNRNYTHCWDTSIHRYYAHCWGTCPKEFIHTAETPAQKLLYTLLRYLHNINYTHCWHTCPAEIIHTAEIPASQILYTLLRYLPNRIYTHSWDTCPKAIIHTAEIPA